MMQPVPDQPIGQGRTWPRGAKSLKGAMGCHPTPFVTFSFSKKEASILFQIFIFKD